MLRRSERLKEKNMSNDKVEESCSEDEAEKTVMEQDPVAELREEMRSLRAVLEAIVHKVNMPSNPEESMSKNTITSNNMPENVTVPTKCDNSSALPIKSSTLPASNEPSMQPKLSIHPNYYSNLNLPHSSTYFLPPAQSTVSMPQTPSTVSFLPVPSTAYMSTYAPTTISMPHLPNSISSQTPPLHQTQAPNQPTNTSLAGNITTPDLYDHRPIRKLYDLPEFNGQPEQWPRFIVSYKETTQSYNYSNLENLTRLQKALKGEAMSKVEAYTDEKDCFSYVWL